MAQFHQAKAHFQTDSTHLVEPVVSDSRNEPLPSSVVISLFDTLRQRVDDLRDRELKAKAVQAISNLQSDLRGNSHGLMGKGFGHNTRKKEFYHDGKQYRIDLELNGEMKG